MNEAESIEMTDTGDGGREQPMRQLYLWKFNRKESYGGDFLLLPTEQALLARSDRPVTIVWWELDGRSVDMDREQ